MIRTIGFALKIMHNKVNAEIKQAKQIILYIETNLANLAVIPA